jgi:tape measure domain-containing protein
MGAELGTGYISIIPEVSKISPTIAKALGGVESEAERRGGSWGSKLAAGVGKTLKAGALATGVAAGGLIGTAMAKGMGRLTAIENAQQKLLGLGNDTKTVAGVMNDALSSVKGTAFGLGEAASVAAGLVAAGIKPGQQLETTLKTVGDTAAIAGRSMQDVGVIFGSIAARGKLQGDDMLQLMASGIPVLQLLAKETGKTSAEISDMVSKGKIDFETFEKAMRAGMGGSALKMGESFTGAAANAQAALGRLGATALKPFFGLAKDGLVAATGAIDGLETKIKPVAADIDAFLQQRLVPGLKDAKGAVSNFLQSDQGKGMLTGVQAAFTDVLDTGKALAPVVSTVATALGQASAALGVSTWQVFLGTLHAASGVLVALAPSLQAVADLLKAHPGLLAAAMTGWMAFRTVPGIVGGITTTMGQYTSKLSEMRGHVSSLSEMRGQISSIQKFYRDAGVEMDRVGATTHYLTGEQSGLAAAVLKAEAAFQQGSPALKTFAEKHTEAAHTARAALGSIGDAAVGVARGGFSLLKSGAEGLLGALGGPWGLALTGAAAALTLFASENEKAARAEQQHKNNVDDLKNSLNGIEEAATRSVMVQRASSEGLIDLASKAGIASSTVVDAMMGQASGLEAIQGKAESIVTAFMHAHPQLQQAKISADDLEATLNGNKDAALGVATALADLDGGSLTAKQNAAESFAKWKEGLTDADLATLKLAESTRGANNDLEEATRQHEAEAAAMTNAAKEADAAAQIYSILGDKIKSIPDDKTIKVESDAITDETKQKLEAMGAKVSEPFEGQVTIDFPDAFSIISLLDQMGVKLSSLDGYIHIDNAEVPGTIEKLDALGLKTKTLPGGKVVIDSNDPDVKTRMLDLGILVKDRRTGEVKINDNVPEVIKRIHGLSGQNTTSRHTISVETVYVGGGRPALLPDGSPARRAMGGVVGLAAGGLFGTPAGYRLPLSGPGTTEIDGFQGVDKQGRPTARVDAGEWVINRRSSAKHHNLLRAINDDSPKLNKILGGVQALADGGVVTPGQLLRFAKGETVNGKKAPRSLEGAPYVFGGGLLANWGDCSGAMSGLAALAVGWPLDGRKFATMDEGPVLARMGFSTGLGSGGPRFSIGWLNGGPAGGHTSGTIYFADGQAVNVEMGGGRGNGQIGGGAAPASHPQYTNHAYLPLIAGQIVTINGKDYDPADFLSLGDDIESTSVDGVKTSRGNVSWGKAQSLFDQAKKYVQYGPKFDTGGRWPSGVRGRNESGADELVLTNQQWKHQSAIAKALPEIGKQNATAAKILMAAGEKFDQAAGEISTAAKLFAHDAEDARVIVQTEGRHFGGGWLDSAEVVRDAEKGLYDLRKKIATETDGISKAEKELADAKKELAKTEKEGAAVSKADRRKLEDAEKSLADARKKGKADRIADAEKKLARVREDIGDNLEKSTDKNAKAVKSAQEKVNKAEDKLAAARAAQAESLADLEAAERTVAASRYQAASEIAEKIGGSLSAGIGHIAGFFSEIEKAAGIVDKTRQEVSKLEMQQQTNALTRVRTLAELQIRERDIERARARGIVSIAQAEAALAEARKQSALMGSTSVEAMKGAIDRFYRTGKFTVEDLTASVVANSKEIQAAEWGVRVARAQAAVDDLEAAKAHSDAQHEALEATLKQTAAAQLLRAQTTALAEQTASLYGMTANQAQGASKGFGGVSKLVGGIGKLLAGAAAGVAGFTVGGPLGALAGAGMALGGLKDLVQGGIDLHQNKDSVKEAWKNLGTAEKAALVLGSAGGAALTIGGGVLSQQYGVEAATGGAKLGEQFMESTIGALQYGISGRIEKSQRQTEDRLTAIQRQIDQNNLNLELDRATKAVEYLRQKDKLTAELEYAKLKQEIEKTDDEKVRKALAAAAEVERLRSLATTTEVAQTGELRQLNATLAELLAVTKRSLATGSGQVGQLSAVDAVRYERARI